VSLARFWWSATSYTDYPDIWDVDIDPESITGANFHSQEPRHASFTYAAPNTVSQTFDLAALHDGIFPYVVQIIEQQNRPTADGEMLEHTLILFEGYVFRGGVSFETVIRSTDNYQYNTIVTNVTLSDYLAVFLHYLKARPQGASTTSGIMHFEAGSEYLVPNEMTRLWETVPIGPDRPLWTRPPLVYDVNPYPGYGMQFENFLLVQQDRVTPIGAWGLPLIDYRYYGNISLNSVNQVVYRTISVVYWANRDNASGEIHFYYALARYVERIVYGASYITQFSHTFAMMGEYPQCEFIQLWDNIVDDWVTGVWQWDGWHDWTYEQTMSVPHTDVVYKMTRYGTSYPHVYGSTPLWNPTQITVSGTVNTAAFRIIADGEMPNADYMAYMLNIYMAWLRQSGGVYYLSNKLFFTTATSSGFTDAVRVVHYREGMDDSIDTFSTTYEFIENSDVYRDLLNAYAIGIYRAYPRLCEWLCNEDVAVGNYVMLPGYNPNLIQITEREYDIEQPGLWRYKGRSA
jgi:hypothetical protein